MSTLRTGVVIRDVLNDTPNTCTFTIDGRSQAPTIGERIEILDDAVLLFAGIVQYVEQVYEGQLTNLAWRVTAVDFTWLLNARWPRGTYTDVSASEIVVDIVNQFNSNHTPDTTFTTDFVQTGLPKLTITFDGTKDCAQVLSAIAEEIGGGHWYVDYDQAVHFFRHVSPVAQMSVMQLGPGTSMTVADGDALGYGGSPYWVVFFSTFVYSDGSESSPSPLSNVLYTSGQNKFSFTGVPIGAAVGALTCTKRRIWSREFTSPTTFRTFAQINDNALTAFQSKFNAESANSALVVAIPGAVGLPRVPSVTPPVGVSQAPTAVAGAGVMLTPSGAPYTYTPGSALYRITNLYRDGTESYGSDPSAAVTLDGEQDASLSNVPIGPTLNGISIVARIAYVSINGDRFHAVAIVADNTATTLPITTSLWESWPLHRLPDGLDDAFSLSVDGPWLENAPAPDDIVDGSLDVQLLNPPFVMSEDGSQIRNRVTVVGEGTYLTPFVSVNGSVHADVANTAGTNHLHVVNASVFSASGGTLIVGGTRLSYTGVSGPSGPPSAPVESGPGLVWMASPLSMDYTDGSPVYPFVTVDDVASQQRRGLAERDKDGNITDGIHEFTIVESSLRTTAQMYARAYAELQLFADIIVTITYATRDAKSKTGCVVSVNLTNPPCVGDFLIQEVTIDQVQQFPSIGPRYTVRASSSKFDLEDLLRKIGERPENKFSSLSLEPLTGIAGGGEAVGAGQAQFSQTHARWRNDDGVAATWRQSEDTPDEIASPVVVVRLRMQVFNTGSASGSFRPALYASLNGAPYVSATTGGSVYLGTSPLFADVGELTAPAGGTFVSLAVSGPHIFNGLVTLGPGEYCEIEWDVQVIVVDTAINNTVTFRVFNDSGGGLLSLDTYGVSPYAVSTGLYAPSSAGVIFKTASFTLTDAQIRSLVTTPVQVVAAVSGKILLPIFLVLHVDTLAGGYNSARAFRIFNPSGVEDLIKTESLEIHTAVDKYFWSYDERGPLGTPANAVGKSLVISYDNSNVTGGNVANTVKGIMPYLEIDAF